MCRGSFSYSSPLAALGKAQGPLVALILASLAHTSAAPAQTVAGRVISADSDEPVGGVTITLADAVGSTQRSVVSNEAGEFVIVILDAGTYVLAARRVGYEDIRTRAIELGDGERVEVELRLDADIVPVEPLTVVARRRENQRERDLREFYERVERAGESHVGPTQVYTRESLERWDPLSVAEALTTYVRWRTSPSDCDPVMFLDGRPLKGRFPEALGSMSVSYLEGIELYSGGGPAESRFWDPAGCGVVLLWTRPVREGRSGLDFFEVVVLGGAAVLLTLGAFLAF